MKIDLTKPLIFFQKNKLSFYLIIVCLICPLLPILAHIIIYQKYIYILLSLMISLTLYMVYEIFIGKRLYYVVHMKQTDKPEEENKNNFIR